MNFVEFVQNSQGRFFEITYTTRRSGETRSIVCRSGVTKGLQGKGGTYDRASRGLLTLFSVTDGGYRAIPIDSVISITYQGRTVGMMTKEEEDFFEDDIEEV